MGKSTELDFMDDSDLLEILSDHANSHCNFCNDFGESLEEWLESHDELTDGQREAVIHIIETHHMGY